MPSLQDIKSLAEKLTGIARPRVAIPHRDPVRYGADGLLTTIWRAG